jgi:hypothetical protein
MLSRRRPRWPVAMGVGLAIGLAMSGLLPNTPLHAVSTDRADTYVMATGPVDADVEAVYFLDLLTGDLGAMVLGRQPGAWSGRFFTNVARDLGVDPQKNSKYLMVTGVAGLRQAGGSRQRWSSAMCYVAEITSGRVAAYGIPWSPPMHAAGQAQGGQLKCVGVAAFRQAAGTGPGLSPSGGTLKGREKEKTKEKE